MLDEVLLQIAKNSILSKFNSKYEINKKAVLLKYPYLNEYGASFVTLNYDARLRGCIGSIVAHRKLLDDVIYNARAAAFSDPRFDVLSVDELPHISLEVSVLSEAKVLEYDDYNDLLKKVRPNVDGLILKHAGYQGTFLPQVWEQLPNPKDFLELQEK